MRPISFLVRHSFDLAQSLLMIEGFDREVVTRIILLPHQYTNDIDLSEINLRSEIIDLRSEGSIFLLHWKLSRKVLAILQSNDLIISFNKNDVVTRYINKWLDVICCSQWRENKHLGLSLDFLRTIKQNIVEISHGLPLSKIFTDKQNSNIRTINQVDLIKEIYFCNQMSDLTDEETVTYPKLPKLPRTTKRDTILIYGGRYLQWNYVEPTEVRDAYNCCIDHLLCKHPNASIIYMPHPLERGEYAHLNRPQVSLYSGTLNAELFTIKMHPSVIHTLSIGSTASISSYHFGIKTTVMFKDLIKDDNVLNVYSQMFEGLAPNIFDMTGAYSDMPAHLYTKFLTNIQRSRRWE